MVTLNKSKQLLHEFLNSEVTQKDKYDICNLIAEVFFSKIKADPKIKFHQGGIAYPSVQSKLISNVVTHNVAMTPEIYHAHYSINKTTIYFLLHENSKYMLQPINSGLISSNDTISWKHSLNDMKNRVSNGILLDDLFCPGIMGKENFL